MHIEQLDAWFSPQQRHNVGDLLRKKVGLTRRRAEFLVRLWVYLLVKQKQKEQPLLRPPLTELTLPQGFVSCTQREAAELFYSDRDTGSDRAAGMMLDRLAALQLIQKSFDGSTTSIKIELPCEIISNHFKL